MSDYKDLYNPDYRKYGFNELDFETPATKEPEPATTTPAPKDNETIRSNWKTILKKRKK